MNIIYVFINISRTITCSFKSFKIHLLMSFNLINRLYFCIIFSQCFGGRATPQSLWDFSSLGPMAVKIQSPNQWTDRLISMGHILCSAVSSISLKLEERGLPGSQSHSWLGN